MSITSGMAGDELMDLGNNERRMLKAMLSKPNQEWSLEQLLSVTGWNDQVHVAGAGKGLQEEGMVEVKETTSRLVSLGEEGNKAYENGLLESRLWDWIRSVEEDQRNMGSLISSGFDRKESGPGIGILKGLGVEIVSGNLVFSDEEEITKEIARRTDFIKSLSNSPVEASTMDEGLISHFSSRSGLLEFEETTSRTWKLTKSGSSVDHSALI